MAYILHTGGLATATRLKEMSEDEIRKDGSFISAYTRRQYAIQGMVNRVNKTLEMLNNTPAVWDMFGNVKFKARKIKKKSMVQIVKTKQNGKYKHISSIKITQLENFNVRTNTDEILNPSWLYNQLDIKN